MSKENEQRDVAEEVDRNIETNNPIEETKRDGGVGRLLRKTHILKRDNWTTSTINVSVTVARQFAVYNNWKLEELI